jgi:hypothetical protein
MPASSRAGGQASETGLTKLAFLGLAAAAIACLPRRGL